MRPPVALVAHTEAGDITVEPAATPGALACLYQASCVRYGAAYPGPFRVPPTPGARRALPTPGQRYPPSLAR